MKCMKIVLTGGPCGGKTTAIQRIEEEFTERGYQVVIVPEAATILINMGIKPFGKNAIDVVEFQRMVIELQIKLESLAMRSIKATSNDVIILCDRGIIDDKAYVSADEFKMLLDEFEIKEMDIMSSYDMVIHLRTVAFGKEEFYTLENNAARSESPEEAREKDQKTLEAWIGHDNLKVIGNDTEFDGKLDLTLYEIYSILNKPYPIQCQRKYLVDSIDLNKIEDIRLIKFGIEQYFKRDDEKELIYRKTLKDSEVMYTLTTKIDTNINSERVTTKRKITEDEYYSNMVEIPIVKERYCFTYKNQYFRLDIFDDGLKVLEIEETNKTKEIVIPDFIKVSNEITNNVMYRNSNLYGFKNQKEKIYCKK